MQYCMHKNKQMIIEFKWKVLFVFKIDIDYG